VVDVVFEDWKDGPDGGRNKLVSFFAKRARGLMARWAVRQRVRSVRALQGFDAEGYAFDAALSSTDRLLFRRHRQPA
jgi:hypothetical protein